MLRPAASLSPGERTRAALALLQARGVNLLVLDEPTNHLDLPAIEQLEQALDSFPGTLLLVSHDRRLLEAVRVTRRLHVERRDLNGGTRMTVSTARRPTRSSRRAGRRCAPSWAATTPTSARASGTPSRRWSPTAAGCSSSSAPGWGKSAVYFVATALLRARGRRARR